MFFVKYQLIKPQVSDDYKRISTLQGRPLLMLGYSADRRVQKYIPNFYIKGVHISRPMMQMFCCKRARIPFIKGQMCLRHGQKVCCEEQGLDGEQRLTVIFRYLTVLKRKQHSGFFIKLLNLLRTIKQLSSLKVCYCLEKNNDTRKHKGCCFCLLNR